MKKDLTIYVPADCTFKAIDAELASADLYINGVTADKIKCDNMSSENKYVDCAVNEITVNTMSGNTAVNTKDKLKKMTYNAMSGNLTVDAEGIDALDVSSMSADISLNVKNADFTLKLTGVTASLEANGINYEKTEENAYKFGDGNGKINFDSTSGKVSVNVK